MFCWLSFCGQAESLPSPQEWPCRWLTWEEERGYLNRGSQHQQTSGPLHSVWQWDQGQSRGPRLSQQYRGCRESTGAAGERAQLCRGQGNYPGTQSPSRALTPFTSEQQGFYKVTLFGGASARLSLGAWPWGLCRGQPGSGHSWTTSLDFRPLLEIWSLLIFHGTVRNHTSGPAASHFRTHLLTGEEERICLPWEFCFHVCLLKQWLAVTFVWHTGLPVSN